MLTRQQKEEMVDKAAEKLADSKTTVFTEFSGVTVESFKKLRSELRHAGADVKVMKKRLVNIALKNAGIPFNPTETKNQLGTVYAKGDLSSVASIIYKFAKGVKKAKKGIFNVLGVYDASEKQIIGVEEFTAVATLPSREILLAQIAMMFTMPIKQMMIVLNEVAKKEPTSEAGKSGAEKASPEAGEPVEKPVEEGKKE